MCRLRLKLGKRWITKMDVGSPSEQPDGGDRMKAAFSDALGRCRQVWDRRDLYRLKADWWDYDPVKKQFSQQPKLPTSALPEAAQTKIAPRPAAKPEMTGTSRMPAKLPANGEELHRRLRKGCQTRGGGPMSGRCAFELRHASGSECRLRRRHSSLAGPAVELAAEETKAFTAKLSKIEARAGA